MKKWNIYHNQLYFKSLLVEFYDGRPESWNQINIEINKMIFEIFHRNKMFNGYRCQIKKDMFDVANWNCKICLVNQQINITNNPFSYMTTIIYNSFFEVLNRIKRNNNFEKKYLSDDPPSSDVGCEHGNYIFKDLDKKEIEKLRKLRKTVDDAYRHLYAKFLKTKLDDLKLRG